jgi:acetyl esterase/lipase
MQTPLFFMGTPLPVIATVSASLLLLCGLVTASAMAAGSTVEHDVAYLGSERAEKLDVYLPPSGFAGARPAVLLIHGGGWTIGDKASSREIQIGQTLSAHGYAVFSINYKLNRYEGEPWKTPLVELAWPQSLYDCKSALRFIRANAARYRVDPKRIAVMGGSAGAHLSLMVGSTAREAEINRHGLYTDQPDDVACIVYFYGEYDVRGRSVSPFKGASAEQVKAFADAASPVNYLAAGLPPIFVTHGSADKTIPVERSRQLVKRLAELGVDYWYVEVGGAPHTYNLTPAQMDLRPVLLSFLGKHLAGEGVSAISGN